MKICIYLEFLKFWNGIFFRRIGTGLLSSYRNQKAVLKSMGVPFCETWENDCDILMVNTPWLKSLWLIRRARSKGKKVIIWAHVTPDDMKGVFRFNDLILPVFRRYLLYAYSQADLVLCPSAYTRGLLIAYGLDKDKLAVQSNGVDIETMKPDAEKRKQYREQYRLDALAVGTVGLAIPRKGIDTFLALAKEFPACRFIWFGKIYSSFMAKPLPKDLPPNVSFTGYVDDISAAFNALDIFLFPSHEENQGMALLEAAAVGLPILARRLPAYQGWLEHDKNCLLALSEADFEKRLASLVSEKSLRERLGRAALVLAREESLAEQGKRLKAVFDKLVNK